MENKSDTKDKAVTRSAWAPAEVAGKTGLSLPFVRKEIASGGLFAVRAGRRWLVPDSELERYVQEGSRKQEGEQDV
jgi:excisionase family DNA binding protein